MDEAMFAWASVSFIWLVALTVQASLTSFCRSIENGTKQREDFTALYCKYVEASEKCSKVQFANSSLKQENADLAMMLRRVLHSPSNEELQQKAQDLMRRYDREDSPLKEDSDVVSA